MELYIKIKILCMVTGNKLIIIFIIYNFDKFVKKAEKYVLLYLYSRKIEETIEIIA
jgi:hypothetical protein